MVNINLPDKKTGGRPGRFMDVVRMDILAVGVNEDAEDGRRRKRLIRCGDP